MEVDELGNQWNDDYHEGYWTYDAEADGENGLNAVSPYKGYNKGYGGKGKGQHKGNFHTKGWTSNKGFQHVYSKGWGKQDGKSSSDNKGWSVSESKGKGKSTGKGFQGECYSCGEWGHSASRCPHAWGSWGSAVSDKGKGKGYSHVAELEVSSGAQHGEDHMSMRDGELGSLERAAKSEGNCRWLCELRPVRVNNRYAALATDFEADDREEQNMLQPSSGSVAALVTDFEAHDGEEQNKLQPSSGSLAATATDFDADDGEEENKLQPSAGSFELGASDFPKLLPDGMNPALSRRNRFNAPRNPQNDRKNHKTQNEVSEKKKEKKSGADRETCQGVSWMSIEAERASTGIELSTVDEAQNHRKDKKLVMTVDSGAGESVCGPLDAPEYEVLPSEEQRPETYYLAAGGRATPQSGGETHPHQYRRWQTVPSADASDKCPQTVALRRPDVRREQQSGVREHRRLR